MRPAFSFDQVVARLHLDEAVDLDGHVAPGVDRDVLVGLGDRLVGHIGALRLGVGGQVREVRHVDRAVALDLLRPYVPHGVLQHHLELDGVDGVVGPLFPEEGGGCSCGCLSHG